MDYYCDECKDQHRYECPREVRRKRGLFVPDPE